MFPKILDETLKSFTTERIFLFSSFHYILESENFRFSFSTKNSPTRGVKCEKLKFRKRRKFIRQASKIEHEWDWSSWNF